MRSGSGFTSCCLSYGQASTYRPRPTYYVTVLVFLCLYVCTTLAYVVHKATAHVETKTLNMLHQAQNGFCSIFVGIPEHQKGYLVYGSSTRKIISSYDVVFDERFYSSLAYTSQPYSEAMAISPAATYTPYDTSSKEKLAM